MSHCEVLKCSCNSVLKIQGFSVLKMICSQSQKCHWHRATNAWSCFFHSTLWRIRAQYELSCCFGGSEKSISSVLWSSLSQNWKFCCNWGLEHQASRDLQTFQMWWQQFCWIQESVSLGYRVLWMIHPLLWKFCSWTDQVVTDDWPQEKIQLRSQRSYFHSATDAQLNWTLQRILSQWWRCCCGTNWESSVWMSSAPWTILPESWKFCCIQDLISSGWRAQRMTHLQEKKCCCDPSPLLHKRASAWMLQDLCVKFYCYWAADPQDYQVRWMILAESLKYCCSSRTALHNALVCWRLQKGGKLSCCWSYQPHEPCQEDQMAPQPCSGLLRWHQLVCSPSEMLNNYITQSVYTCYS